MSAERRVRARFFAAPLAIALLALLATRGPALWEWAAYEAPSRQAGFEIRKQRWSWLPGPDIRVPRQPCAPCQAGDHAECGRRSGEVVFLSGRHPDSDGATSFEATIRSNWIVIDGVEITPEQFSCPCCGFD